METVLEIKHADLYAADGDGIRKVISGYDLTVNSGDVTTVTVDSAEETHLLYVIITGDREPTAGTVKRKKGMIGRIRKGSEVFAELTVRENIGLAASGKIREDVLQGFGFDSDMDTAELGRVDRVKLLFLQRYLQEPVYITAEEPFTGLDEDEIRQVTEFIMGETEKTGIPVVIIETKETGGIPG